MIYVHIPFCTRFCAYCGFYSTTALHHKPLLLDSIAKEWRLLLTGNEPLGNYLEVPTLYFGGGTPSLCTPEEIGTLINTFTNGAAPAQVFSEITLEANPCDLTYAYCVALRQAGVNRLSIGIQSFHDSELKAMRRRHNAAGAIEAFHNARKAGFTNCSIDLLLGTPSLTLAHWKTTLEQAVALRPEHLSAYQLSIEPSAPWGRAWAENRLALPSSSQCEAQYRLLQQTLRKAGYVQYEISNFCLPGFASRHNSAYWQRTPYVGLGPAAHSFNGQIRYKNPSHLPVYIDRVQRGTIQRKKDVLRRKDIYNEWVMLGLRTAAGIPLTQLKQHVGNAAVTYLLQQAAPLVANSKMECVTVKGRTYLRLRPAFFLTADFYIRQCLR